MRFVLPISNNWWPEVKLAKKNDIKNLIDCKTFEELIDKGQKVIGSNQKEKHNGQK